MSVMVLFSVDEFVSVAKVPPLMLYCAEFAWMYASP